MSKNFQPENADLVVSYLHATGEDRTARITHAMRSVCSDPRCCGSEEDPTMREIVTSVSGARLHTIAVILGVVWDPRTAAKLDRKLDAA